MRDSKRPAEPRKGEKVSASGLGTHHRLYGARTRTTRAPVVSLLLAASLVGSGLAIVSLRPLAVKAATGTWAPGDWAQAGPMALARSEHTATVLSGGACSPVLEPARRAPYCGDVLAVGGIVGGSPSKTVEVYDARARAWSATAPMSVARAGHTATALADGRVLVAGGTTAGGVVVKSAELYDPLTGTWATAADLLSPRSSHTANVTGSLHNARVLVIGGHTAAGTPIGSTERYDPVANTWTAAGSLATARGGHTTSHFTNGRLLVIGGIGQGGLLASTELYNPADNTSVFTSPLRAPRTRHTATVVVVGTGNVEVLVAGGDGISGPLASAEVYKVSSDGVPAWSPSGRLSFPRSGHTATLFGDRKVLIVGGTNEKLTDIWDANDALWHVGPSLSSRRTAHTVTELPDHNQVLVAGGSATSAGGATSSTETFYGFWPALTWGVTSSGAAQTWGSAPSLTVPRDFSAVSVLDGPACRNAVPVPAHCHDVLVVGGADGAPPTEIYSYDAAASRSGTWSIGPPPVIARRAGHTATLLDGDECRAAGPPAHCGMVLVAGGRETSSGDRGGMHAAELYNPQAGVQDVATLGSWAPTGAMTKARTGHTATLLKSGKVLVVGGTGPLGTAQSVTQPDTAAVGPLASAELYDPVSAAWQPVAALAVARTGHTATLLGNGKVLVVGGSVAALAPTDAAETTASVEIYDPQTNRWSSCTTGAPDASCPAPLKMARERHTATLIHSGKLFVVGGRKAGTQLAPSGELYDPEAGTWSAAGTNSLIDHSATLLPSGRVLLAGGQGYNARGYFTHTDYRLYDPDDNSLKVISRPMVQNRSDHSATLLPGAQVLIIGGIDGFGAPGRVVDSFDGVVPPASPADLTLSLAGDGSALLDWAPPANDGGSRVTDYRVTVTPDAPVDRAPGATSAAISGLDPQVKYVATVQAINRAGAGRGVFAYLRVAPVPQAPGAVMARPGNGSATVSWEAARCVGCTVSGYRVISKPTGAAPAPVVEVGPDATSATVPGLEDGRSYTFSVQASSADGDGPVSLPSNTIVPGLPKGQPTIFSASPRSRSALVSWTAPPDAGASALTTYTVTAHPGGASATVAGDATRAVVPGLTNGTAYRFTVQAANAFGPGIERSSPSVDVTPLLEPAALAFPATSPAASPPSVFDVYPRGGPTTGGTESVVTGTGFGGATAVNFGATPAASYAVVSDHQIVATVPAHPEGRLDITVSNTAATSKASPAGAFTYGEGGWESTGAAEDEVPTIEERFKKPVPTVTMLANGKILATAVDSFVGASRMSAQIYDAATGLWTKTGGPGERLSMATLLPTGKVLAFAGADFGRAAECLQTPQVPGFDRQCRDPGTVPWLYDPGEQKWSRVGETKPKATAANGATAVLSGPGCGEHCGKVLVAGGCCQPPRNGWADRPHSSAELYNPTTGTWSETGELLLGRARHTLTVLKGPNCGENCGKVLAVGGYRRATSAYATELDLLLPPPELYDPKQGTWSRTGDMKTTNRYGHVAVLLHDGKVLVAGGSVKRSHDGRFGSGYGDFGNNPDHFAATATAEIYDPATGEWTAVEALATPRLNAAFTLLPDGKVLVAGGMGPSGAIDTAEIFDPATARWSSAGAMRNGGARFGVLLTGPGCGANCGKVLFRGDCCSDWAELYSLQPNVSAFDPASGPVSGTEVTVHGRGFLNEAVVTIGGAPADVLSADKDRISVRTRSPRVAVAPVQVVTTGGTSRSSGMFSFVGPPGRVDDLRATNLSAGTLELSFSAAGSVGRAEPAAARYVIKQSRSPIESDNFDEARSLCAETGGVCGFQPTGVGHQLSVSVGGLRAGTTYYYALRPAGSDGQLGELSNVVEAATPPATPNLCPETPTAAGGQIVFDQGYKLIGVPSGSDIGADSPLYGWFNRGSGSYSTHAASHAEPGRGYWAWFACPRLVVLGAGQGSTSFPLGAYKASMVGNPSATSSAEVSGHDFAATWDPTLNAGAGGYHISGFREARSLAVGSGVWVFSYRETTVEVRAG